MANIELHDIGSTIEKKNILVSDQASANGTGYALLENILKLIDAGGTLADGEHVFGINGSGDVEILEFDATATGSTFQDNTFNIKNQVDATKIGQFDMSAITTATTRTISFPDKDGTIIVDDGTNVDMSNDTRVIDSSFEVRNTANEVRCRLYEDLSRFFLVAWDEDVSDVVDLTISADQLLLGSQIVIGNASSSFDTTLEKLLLAGDMTIGNENNINARAADGLSSIPLLSLDSSDVVQIDSAGNGVEFGWNATVGGDMRVDRGSNQGVLYLGNASDGYIYFDGSNIYIASSPVVIGADPGGNDTLRVGGNVYNNGSFLTNNTGGGFYLGDATTDGTWRLQRIGNDLHIQRRESGVYNTKQTISA